MNQDLQNFLKDIPDIKLDYNDLSIVVLSIRGPDSDPNHLFDCYTEYFKKLAYDDDVYNRFMTLMRLLKNPFDNTYARGSIDKLMLFLQTGKPMIEVLALFDYIVHFALKLKEPLICLQRRNFTLYSCA